MDVCTSVSVTGGGGGYGGVGEGLGHSQRALSREDAGGKKASKE